jgi:hypothetical protein
MGNKPKLRFVERLDVRNETAGLTEPSGLTVSRDGKTLWTVSDDTMTVLQLDLKGKLVDGASLAVGQAGFEGIALFRMFNTAIPSAGIPRYLGSDNDPLFRYHRRQANLRILDVTRIQSVRRVPLSHPFIERLIRTIRRE